MVTSRRSEANVTKISAIKGIQQGWRVLIKFGRYNRGVDGAMKVTTMGADHPQGIRR